MDARQFLKWAKEHGWRMALAGSGHNRWTHPAVRTFITVAATPRCPRAWLNARGDMRRAMLQSGFKKDDVR